MENGGFFCGFLCVSTPKVTKVKGRFENVSGSQLSWESKGTPSIPLDSHDNWVEHVERYGASGCGQWVCIVFQS